LNPFYLLSVEVVVSTGYNGSQLWDTAFTVQAILATNLIEDFGPTIKLAHGYIKNSQVNA
jgi:squalene cyclase